MNHIMIDIETLSTAHNAIVVELAAVQFGLDGTFGREFYAKIDPKDSMNFDLRLDFDTMKWHAENSLNPPWNGSDKLIPSLLGLKHFMGEVKDFHYNQGKELKIWANSPSFDLLILKNNFQATNIEMPWKYYQEMDMRTVLGLLPKRKKLNNNHKALDDCKNQIEALIQSMRELKIA